MAFTQGHALVIGVGAYPQAPALNAHAAITAADAEAVAQLLRDEERCGYPASQVRTLTHAAATRAGLLAGLDELAKRAEAESTVFLFYCGHGEYGHDGAYYLTTADTRLRTGKVDSGSGLRDDELLAKLRTIRARRVLLIFNACHAGEISPTLGGARAERTGAPLPQKDANAILATGRGRAIITACRPNQVSFIGPGPLTIFTQALLAGMRGETTSGQAGYIGLFDLYTQLYYSLEEALQQQIDPGLLTRYGGRQEPELTMLQNVGSFPVALYRGASSPSRFAEGEQPPQDLGVRQVPERRSQHDLGSFGISVTDNSSVLNFGSGNQFGDVSIGDVAGRDIIRTNIDARGAQGPVFNPTAPLNQVFGNQHNVDTGGGTYYEHYEDNREGTFVEKKYEFSGTFTNAIFNIENTLENTTQTINGSTNGSAEAREQVKQLIEQMKAELKKVPEGRVGDAETVAELADAAVAEASKPQPKKGKVEISANGLKQAAENIKDVLPDVVGIATKIATAILAFV